MTDTTSTTKEETILNDEPKPKVAFYRRRRTWIICLAILIADIAIILPILFLVIIPKIIKSRINDTNLHFSTINVSMPITESSFLLQNTGELSGGGSTAATLKFPDPVDIRWNGTILGNFMLDNLNLHDGQASLNQSQTFNITDNQRWFDFVQTLLASPEFIWTVEGNITVKALGVVKKGIAFNKDITIKGLALSGAEGFNNITVTNYTISTIKLANGTSFIGQVINTNIHSPADLSIFVGTIGFDIYYGELYIGPVQADNQTIYPGNNNLVLQGPLAFNIATLPPAILADLLTKYIKSEPLTANIRGAFSKPDGIHEVSWLSNGIKLLNFNKTVKISQSPLLDGLAKLLGNI